MRRIYLVAIIAAVTVTSVAPDEFANEFANIPTKCPIPDEPDTTHIAHETDCHKFYKCHMGQKVEMTCRSNLCFNRELQVCDWPWNVTCCNGGASQPTTTQSTTTQSTTTQSTTTQSSTTQSSTTQPTPSSTTTTTPPPPSSDNDCASHKNDDKIKHETDCRQYYICQRGRKTGPYCCRDNLYFNPIIRECDVSSNAPSYCNL